MTRKRIWLLLAVCAVTFPGCGGCTNTWWGKSGSPPAQPPKIADKLPDFVLDGLRTLPNEMPHEPRRRKRAIVAQKTPPGDEAAAEGESAQPAATDAPAEEPTDAASTGDPNDIDSLVTGDAPTTAGSATVGAPAREFTAEDLAEPGYAYIKPGHWTSATVGATAYNFDFRGDLVTEPFDLPKSAYRLGSARRAILPRGEHKQLEVTLFVPPGQLGDSIDARLQPSLRSSPVASQPNLVSRMPPHQFFFVVLAREPDSYLYLNNLPALNPAITADYLGFEPRHYRLLLPRPRGRVPLSTNSLTWSPIAYLLWDRAAPEALTAEQQQALVDWLHWGGQLIVSGPDTLDQLRGSFLAPYLPVDSGGAYDLSDEALESLNAAWTLPGSRPLAMAARWSVERLAAREGAITLVAAAGEPLVVERTVGRGRVVVTGFRLAQRELTVWPSFDSFLNACLLRRPSRRYYFDNVGQALSLGWNTGDTYFAPHLISRVRYFSRDLGAVDVDDDPAQASLVDAILGREPDDIDLALARMNEPERIGPSVASWDDYNSVGKWARHNLLEASRIEIPDRRFVAIALLGYLLILAPVNWIVFRLLGRVEWAWICVPLISLASTIVIVRQARLDIGFARARTEFGIVELFRDYPRAHITRYTSLYTSIGTRYDLTFDDRSALAQPLGTGQERAFGQTASTVYLRRDEKISLEGFAVPSNSLGTLHSEHMLDVGGSLSLRLHPDGHVDLVNGTSLHLTDVRVTGNEGRARLAQLEPGAVARIEFGEPSARPATSPALDGAGLSAANRENLLVMADAWRGAGGLFLTAWTAGELAGMNVSPAPSQSKAINLVVCQLEFELPPPAAADQNTRDEVLREIDKEGPGP